MPLSDLDRSLLRRCLERAPRAWEDFVDRFLGLVLHVVDHTARVRQWPLAAQDREDLASEVFLTLISDDFAVLRRFRQRSSLATYLTVITRRVVVRELLRRGSPAAWQTMAETELAAEDADELLEQDQLATLLDRLQGSEAEIVRLFHLEGRSYHEIAVATGIPENSIGPTLSRARAKLRRMLTSS